MHINFHDLATLTSHQLQLAGCYKCCNSSEPASYKQLAM